MDNQDIKRYIPQREPIVMVDELCEVRVDTAVTSLLVREDNFFLDDDHCMAEVGLIEHIAQSASALAGYKAVESGAVCPPIGYIGEVKKFRCYRRPRVGEQLRTTVSIGEAVGDILPVVGEASLFSGEKMAEMQMKISMKPIH